MDELGRGAASSGLQPSTGAQVLETRARAGLNPQLDCSTEYLVQHVVLLGGPPLKPYDFLNSSPGHYKLLWVSCQACGLLQRCELADTQVFRAWSWVGVKGNPKSQCLWSKRELRTRGLKWTPNPKDLGRKAETGFNQRNKVRKVGCTGEAAGVPRWFLQGQSLSLRGAGPDKHPQCLPVVFWGKRQLVSASQLWRNMPGLES